MSSKTAWLSLRLEGPLQAWGIDSQYNRRNTALMPTKSAIAGMSCAALGHPRGSGQEGQFLSRFRRFKMTSLVIPRKSGKRDLHIQRLHDYHTVQNTKRASGAVNHDCVLTHRYYLTDAAFGIIIEGAHGELEELRQALLDPKWGVWLGRKACIPTSPILAGLFSTREEALKVLIGDADESSFTRQEEVPSFTEGKDSLPDQAVSFDPTRREYVLRRVRTIQGI